VSKTNYITPLAGVLLVLWYLSFALLAFLYYPSSYLPTTNWLSGLGSRNLNPHGAIFYNAGIMGTASFVFLFFVSLRQLRIPTNRKQKAMLLVTLGFGMLGAFSLMMSAVYPIDLPESHAFWSVSLYVMLGTAFAFSVAALRYHPACPRWLLASGIVVAAVDILSGVFGTSSLMEWVTVGLFLLYVLAITIGTKRL
jgi:hypothetical membrane protein